MRGRRRIQGISIVKIDAFLLAPQLCRFVFVYIKKSSVLHMRIIPLLLFVSIVSLLPPLAAQAKPAICTVKQNGAIQFSGPCQFQQFGGDGSFSIVNARGGVIVARVTQISVYIMRGMAEVRGLTVDGIHSRWGSARRNVNDPACWDGSDFQICAR